METRNCRFCLDDSEHQNNSLISPCTCKGSVQHVHEKCLQKWRSIAPAAFTNTCQLCMNPFTVSVHLLESIPNERGFQFQILICPYPPFFLIKYLVYLFGSISLSKYDDAFQSIGIVQMFLHIFYFVCFFQNFQVNNLRLYLKQVRKPHRLFCILIHASAIYFTFESHNLIETYMLDIFLPMYWHFHLRSLEEINLYLQ
jgi:hypothetical protein